MGQRGKKCNKYTVRIFWNYNLSRRSIIIFMVCFVTTVISQAYDTQYIWVQFNDRFDCIAGISANGIPVSTGVFISTRTLLTSANPLQEFINKNSTEGITIHTISDVFNNSKIRKAVRLAGDQSFRRLNWVTIGYNDKTHTTIHDILLITLFKGDRIERRERNLVQASLERRRPFPVDLPYANRTFLPPGGVVFAGFGYIDDNHVSDNTDLEVSYYQGSTIADCDNWIPREWGRFICLINEENLVGVAAGMPLFHSRYITTVIGLGCFELQKGDESVLVFTDLRPYVDHLYGYMSDD